MPACFSSCKLPYQLEHSFFHFHHPLLTEGKGRMFLLPHFSSSYNRQQINRTSAHLFFRTSLPMYSSKICFQRLKKFFNSSKSQHSTSNQHPYISVLSQSVHKKSRNTCIVTFFFQSILVMLVYFNGKSFWLRKSGLI